MTCVAEWPAVTEFAERYGAARGEELDRIKTQMEAGMRLQRGAALVELNTFVAQGLDAPDPGVAQKWLKALREKYEKLLPGV